MVIRVDISVTMNRMLSLGEGNTPLVESSRVPRLYFKLESLNPSGSYKDRFAAGEVERMLAAGQRACVATSSGNTGAALAAYAARNGVGCTIVVSEFAPAGKLVQMRAHGARVIRVPGFTVDPVVTERVMDGLARYSRERDVPLVVSAYRYCPVGMARVEELGRELPAGAHVFVPVGSGGLFIATCRGLAGRAAGVYAVQPEGCSTVAAAWSAGRQEITPVESTTRISGLSVPYDIDGSLALRTLCEHAGKALTVSDEAVFAAQREMFAEGIYAEPAGATALAGARRARELGWIRDGDPVVCLVTGHGFKDPDAAMRAAECNPEERVQEDALWRAL
jgi:threonine synthase